MKNVVRLLQFFINIHKLIINNISSINVSLGTHNESSIFATTRLFPRLREREKETKLTHSKAAAIINSPLCPKCRRL